MSACRVKASAQRGGGLSPTGIIEGIAPVVKRRVYLFNCVKGIRAEEASKSLVLRGFSERL